MPVRSPSLVVLNIFHNRSHEHLEEVKSAQHSRGGSDSQSLGGWVDEDLQQAERISATNPVSLLSETRSNVIRYRNNAPKILNISDANASSSGIACAPLPSQVDWFLKFHNLKAPFNTWDYWNQDCNVVKYGLTWDAACLYIKKFKSDPERLMALKTSNPADLHLESWEIEAMTYGLTRTEVIDMYGLKYFKTHLQGMKTCHVLKFANQTYSASFIMQCLEDGIDAKQIILMIKLGLIPDQIKDLNHQQIAAMTLGLSREEVVNCSNFTSSAAIRTVKYLQKHQDNIHQAMSDIMNLNEYQIDLLDQKHLTVEQLKENHNVWSVKAISELNLMPLLVYIHPINETEYLAMKIEKEKLERFVLAAKKEKSLSFRERFFSKLCRATNHIQETSVSDDNISPTYQPQF